MAWQNETNIKGPSGAPGPAGPTDWNLLTNKPATFPPTVPIAWTDVSGKPATFPPTVPIAWTDVSGKPATFPPTVPIAWTDVSGKPATFPPTLPIAQSDITNLTTDLAGKVAKAGDAMSGNLGVVKATPTIYLDKTSGTYADLAGRQATKNRWTLRLGDNAVESGSNVGSNFQLYSWSDTDVAAVVMSIARSNGIVNLVLGATTLAPAAADSSTRIPTTAWVAGELAGKVAKAGDTMTGSLQVPEIRGTTTGNTELVLGPLTAGRILFRPGGDGSVVGACQIDATGALTVAAGITAGAAVTTTGQQFNSTQTAVLLACAAGGTVSLHPNASGSTTGRLQVSTTGLGVFGAAPAARGAMALPTGTIQRTTYVTSSVTLPQLAGVVMAIITDLRSMGFFT